MMRIDVRKTNPTKYHFSQLAAVVTGAHVLSLILREGYPQGYLLIENIAPFEVVILLAASAVLVYLWGIISRVWEYLQTALLMMTVFYLVITISLLHSHLYNGVIMWAGAVVVCFFTYRMKPVELLRGKESGK